ncbi:cation diffusion facilitator family transporter [Elongatibacter sediminis]|uniref:Cation diffusion facilitator family transporter n=1 Tax=Elongatibacter sediminis TaxID=3119006 RepID=A0AAW9RL33_9GAMM
MSAPDSLKSILFAFFANLSIAIAKGVAAIFTGSGAMLAETIHSLADSGNQLLLILGLRQTRRDPTDEHPLGFGKSIYFWSFLVAVILFTIGGMFSVYEGIHKLQHPEPLSHAWVAFAVLSFAIVAESISLWGCMREVNKERHGRNLWQWFRQSRTSALIVVFGEDIAALLGLVLALLAVLVSVLTGNPLWDALGTITIGVLLIIIAVFIAIEVKQLLIGQSVEPRQLDQMRAFLQEHRDVDDVYNLLTLQFGPDAVVAVKARMTPQASDVALVESINGVELAFREQFPSVRWLFFEPDVHD